MNWQQWLMFAAGALSGTLACWAYAKCKQERRQTVNTTEAPALSASPGVAMDDVLLAMGAEGFDGRERRLAIEVDRDMGIEPTYQDYARTRTRKAPELETAEGRERAAKRIHQEARTRHIRH